MRVALLSQAPGVAGGERGAILPFAHSNLLDLCVIGPESVCEFAESAGLVAARLELPRAHSLLHALRVVAGSRMVKRLVTESGAEVLYANGTRAMPYGVGARVFGGPPLLAHHHGLLTTGPVRSLVFGLQRWSEAIVVPSRASAAPFSRDDKVNVVPNGIDLSHFRPPADAQSAKEALGLSADSPVVGTVSRADPAKGMEAFVSVAETLTAVVDVRYLIVGGAAFPDEQGDYERTRLRGNRSLGDQALFTGWLDDPLSAYQAMDVFVHLGNPEGFSLAVIEAMACGVPVVAYRWGGVAETISDGVNGLLVEPENQPAARDAIRRLLNDSSQRFDLGARGRADCEERYDMKRYARDISSIVHATAGR